MKFYYDRFVFSFQSTKVVGTWVTINYVLVLFCYCFVLDLGSDRSSMTSSCHAWLVMEPFSVMCDRQFQGKNSMKRQISGYIVYSGEIRKLIQQENPECTFGEISRIVGGKVAKRGHWVDVVTVACLHNGSHDKGVSGLRPGVYSEWSLPPSLPPPCATLSESQWHHIYIYLDRYSLLLFCKAKFTCKWKSL